MSDSTVRRYRPPRRRQPSQTWRPFLENHLGDIVAMDTFVVPTATFRVLYVRLIMAHDQRRILGSPWQNAYCERLIGTIRRECLDQVVVLNERHLLRVLHGYTSYYHGSRTHSALDGDSPEGRAVEPPELGNVIAYPRVGGLHRRYAPRPA